MHWSSTGVGFVLPIGERSCVSRSCSSFTIFLEQCVKICLTLGEGGNSPCCLQNLLGSETHIFSRVNNLGIVVLSANVFC